MRLVRMIGEPPKNMPYGKKWCPHCKKFYTPRYPSKAEANKTMDAEGREQ